MTTTMFARKNGCNIDFVKFKSVLVGADGKESTFESTGDVYLCPGCGGIFEVDPDAGTLIHSTEIDTNIDGTSQNRLACEKLIKLDVADFIKWARENGTRRIEP